MNRTISYKQKRELIELFHRTELREGEESIDNRIVTMSKDTGLKYSTIGRIIVLNNKEKINKIGKTEKEYLSGIEFSYEEVGNKPKEIDIKDINTDNLYFSP